MMRGLQRDCQSRLEILSNNLDRSSEEENSQFPLTLSPPAAVCLRALMWRCAETKGGCTRQQLLCPCSCRSMFQPHAQQGSSRRGCCTPLRLRKQIKRQLQQSWRVRADSSEGVAQSESQSGSKEKPKPAKAAEEMPQPVLQLTAIESHGLKPLHLVTFFIILGAGLVFLSVLLYFTADIQFQQACFKVRGSPSWSVRMLVCATWHPRLSQVDQSERNSHGLALLAWAGVRRLQMHCCLGLALGHCMPLGLAVHP